MLRRSFFKKCLTMGAGLIPSILSRKITHAGFLDRFSVDKGNSSVKAKRISLLGLKSKIIIGQDANILDKGDKVRKDITNKIIPESIKNLTGEKNTGNAWKALFSKDDVVGIKVNCLAG